jgi:hypothetical protein
MVEKHSPNRIGTRPDFPVTSPLHAPHVVYANLDFRNPRRGHVRRLFGWLWQSGLSGWEEDRALRYLERHQEEFRGCLRWLSESSIVDFSGVFDQSAEITDREYEDRWRQTPELKFLQQHGLDHGTIVLGPDSQHQAYLKGLRLDQKNPRDPLDPLCWYLLSLLAFYGTVFVRQCDYWRCGKFFTLPTVRRRHCSDSCRVLANRFRTRLDPEKGPQFREHWNSYMRGYNQRPDVKKREPKPRKH